MYNFIEKATKEYKQNGRSKAFIAMENHVIKSGKPIQVYFFSRYAKGASIERLQPLIEQSQDIELGYYFCKNVKDANIRPFMEKACQTSDIFWINKFVEMAKDTPRYIDIYDLIMGLPKGTLIKNITKYDINDLIEDANEEYEKNGRSQEFIELEKRAVHSLVPAHVTLFLKNVPSARIRKFEQAALLDGNPFNIFLIAMHENSNTALMLKGLELAKLNYTILEQEEAERDKRRAEIKKLMDQTNERLELCRLTKLYDKVGNNSEYIAKIDNDYIARINYKLKTLNIKK